MKICLIGDFIGNPDEGMKIVARHLSYELERIHDIMQVDIHHAFDLKIWLRLRRFRPEILHYISGPSPFSFVILRALMMSCEVPSNRQVSTVMSGTQPWLPLNTISFLRKIRPDLFIAQSSQSEEYFHRMGFNVRFLPNGVDVESFKPVNDHERKHIRLKYGIGVNDFLVLHVGPIRANRGLDTLKEVAGTKNCKVLVIGSTSSPCEKTMIERLSRSGCIVWREYLGAIHEVYQMADLYVFPVEDCLGTIEVPLSVLEAMSCNLPVITTAIGGLTRMFDEGEGLFLVKSRYDIIQLLKSLRRSDVKMNVQTRKKVLPFSWSNIAEALSSYYQELAC